jgi:hypothetical protein
MRNDVSRMPEVAASRHRETVMRRTFSPRFALLAVAGCCIGLWAALPARADLIPFTVQPNTPEVMGVGGSLSYDATTDVFHAQMTTSALMALVAPYANGGFAFIDNGTSSVDLKVNNNGAFAGGGMVKITGAIDIDGDGTPDVVGTASDPLLFGAITSFGADPAGPPTRSFDGFFNIQGGELTQMIALSGGGSVQGGYSDGGQAVFLLSAENVDSGILGNFQQSFSSSSVKTFFPIPTPEPASLIVAMIGAASLGTIMAIRSSRARSRTRF